MARRTKVFGRALAGDALNPATIASQRATERRWSLLAGDPFSRAMRMPAGDPFSLKLPKRLRKLSLKKVVSGVSSAVASVGRLAFKAAPMIAGLVGGAPLAATVAQLQSQLDQHAEPEKQGPPGAVAGGYMVPGVEVTAPYTGARSRMSSPPDAGGEEEEPADYGSDESDESDEEPSDDEEMP
jgi:hypothetical protein